MIDSCNEVPESYGINFAEIIHVLIVNKLKILIITLAAAILSVIVAFQIPILYLSESTLMINNQGNSSKAGMLAGQLSGLANLAGVDIGGSASNRSVYILESLKSRAFIEYFIEKRELFVPLFAGVAEDTINGDWILDPEVYDLNNKTWVRVVKKPFKTTPTHWEAYKIIMEKVLTISEEKKTGVVRLRLELRSSSAAKQWNDWIVDDFNDWIRNIDIVEKKSNIEFLIAETEKTQVAEMRKILFSLIEKEQTDYMLANTQKQYALKIVDPAVVPLIRSFPNRPLIAIAGTLIGFVISICGVLLIKVKFS